MTELKTMPKWADGKAIESLFPGFAGKTRRYQLLNEGLIRAKKVGRTTLFDVESIGAYIDAMPDYGKAT